MVILQMTENQKYNSLQRFFLEKKSLKKHIFLAYFQIRL